MSRSYRKHPVCRDICNAWGRHYKRLSKKRNRKSAKHEDAPLYRRYYKYLVNPWEIHDYSHYGYDENEFLRAYESRQKDYRWTYWCKAFKNKEEALNWYRFCYKRK